jgi:aryl-alcohol dehydrogenase
VRITAAVVEEKGARFELHELELGEPRPDEVVVRVVAAGVCHTDLIIRDQWYPVPLPLVLGHEGAGVVEAVGSAVTKVKPGDHVAMSYHSCGACPNCLRGRAMYCLEFFAHNFSGGRPDGSSALTRGGGAMHGHFFGQSSFATYSVASERNVVKVREDVPLELIGPLGCGIQTGAGAVLNGLRPEPGTSLAVFGTGSVGMSAIMAARSTGATKIVGVDLRTNRLELALELGATHVVDASKVEDVAAEVQRVTGGGADYAVETTGLPAVLRQAVDGVRVGGVCSVIGAPPMGTPVSLDMNSILLGRTVRGSVEGDSIPDLFIPALLDLYVQGRFPFDRLIEFYELDEINEAARASEEGRVVKPVVRMGARS